MRDLKTSRKVLLTAAREAGKIIRASLGQAYTYKGRANLVTDTDRKVQAGILRRIARAFPQDGYLAEEEDAKVLGRDYTWVIDPIDGTTNFAHGFPVCAVSIALLKGDVPALGAVLDPFRGELFFAEKGRGATLNGRPMRVSKTPKLSESLLLTGFPYDRHKRAQRYTKLYADFLEICHDIRRSGSAALDLAWTACGRVDGYWEFLLSPWDVAAGRLLVEEAGGRVTDFNNRSWPRLQDYGRQTLATNGLLHAAMMRRLRPYARG